ncbi:MAG: transporter substrate-binding domain-containing protein [Cyclobacteriaceae bacterium]
MRTPLRHNTIATLVLLAHLPFLLSAQLRGDTYSKARQTKSAKFYYVYDGVPGFVDKDASGEVKGLLVDIMRGFESYVRASKGISVSVEFVQVPDKDFKIFMSEVKNGSGGVFGLSNVSIKEERKKDYLFSPAYMNNVSVLISNAKTPTLTNLDDLNTRFAGKKAYSVASSTYYDRLDDLRKNYYPSMEIISLPSVNEVMSMVTENNDAFAVIDLNYYLEALKSKKSIKRHSVGDKGEDKFGVIMPLSNDWEPLIKEFFDGGFIGGTDYRLLITDNLGKGALRLIEGTN